MTDTMEQDLVDEVTDFITEMFNERVSVVNAATEFAYAEHRKRYDRDPDPDIDSDLDFINNQVGRYHHRLVCLVAANLC